MPKILFLLGGDKIGRDKV